METNTNMIAVLVKFWMCLKRSIQKLEAGAFIAKVNGDEAGEVVNG
jgi:hypothetical protein